MVRLRVTDPGELRLRALFTLVARAGYIVVPDQDSRCLVALSSRTYDVDRELLTLLDEWKRQNPAGGLEILGEPSPMRV